MKESLGINIREEVLPFSNMPGVLRPYILTPQKALRAIYKTYAGYGKTDNKGPIFLAGRLRGCRVPVIR